MPRTDDFSAEVKKLLAERVGYYCSFPNCGAITLGPSEESKDSVSRTGMACHIAAAESGPAARRYDENMTSQERKSINNGIWCCYTHGKLIDTDEKRFSVQMLKDWKEIAETTARIMQEKHCSYEAAKRHFAFRRLVTETILLSDVAAECSVAEMLRDCGVELSWGREMAHAVRDLLIELIRNAFDHGNAKQVIITISDNQIILRDDGKKFNPKRELNNGRGGKMAANAVDSLQHKQLIWVNYFEFNENTNKICVLSVANQLEQLTPCSVTIPRGNLYRGNIKFNFIETCEDLYILVPNYLIYSDLWGIQQGLSNLDLAGKTVTIISQHISVGVISYFNKELPNVNILPINEDGHPFS